MKKFDTSKRYNEILDQYGAFFAFSKTQFNKAKKEGVIYASLDSGLICPKDNCKSLVIDTNNLFDEKIKWELENNSIKDIIWYELANHETQITNDISDTVNAVEFYGISEDDVKKVYSEYYDDCVKNDYF